MRKVFYWFGVATALLLVVAVVGGVIIVRKGLALDSESKAYADSAIAAITAKWDQQQLLDRASPELMATLKPAALETVFDQFSRLGPIVKYEGATGQSVTSVFNGASKISAAYIAKAKFQNGDAVIRIALVRREGKWLINSFHVDPDGLPPIKPTEHT